MLHCVVCVIRSCLPSFLPSMHLTVSSPYLPCPPHPSTPSFSLSFNLSFLLLFFLMTRSFNHLSSLALPYISFLLSFLLAFLSPFLPSEYLSTLFFFSPPLLSYFTSLQPFTPSHKITQTWRCLAPWVFLFFFPSFYLTVFFSSLFFTSLTIYQLCQNSIATVWHLISIHLISSFSFFFWYLNKDE